AGGRAHLADPGAPVAAALARNGSAGPDRGVAPGHRRPRAPRPGLSRQPVAPRRAGRRARRPSGHGPSGTGHPGKGSSRGRRDGTAARRRDGTVAPPGAPAAWPLGPLLSCRADGPSRARMPTDNLLPRESIDMNQDKSATIFERAQKLIVGGVNSPVRAFRAVGGTPPFIRSAEGCTLVDADGNRYVDYVGSWGPAILGHAHPAVLERVREAAQRGLSFGAPTELEVEFAELITHHYPSIELLRCVSSGTEATMSALRVAR